jgi:hypothetical protein
MPLITLTNSRIGRLATVRLHQKPTSPLVEFSKAYRYIPKSKWYSLPKKLRRDLRDAEEKRNTKKMLRLYKKAGV